MAKPDGRAGGQLRRRLALLDNGPAVGQLRTPAGQFQVAARPRSPDRTGPPGSIPAGRETGYAGEARRAHLRAPSAHFPRLSVIRTTLAILASILLAVLAAAAVALALLSQHRTVEVAPVEGVEIAYPKDDLPTPEATPRLRPRVTEAAVRLPVPIREQLPIQVRIEGEADATLHAVLLDGTSGAHLGAQPLTSGTTRTLTFVGVPIGKHWVHVTARPERARQDYLARVEVSATAVATCSIARHDLRIHALNLSEVALTDIPWTLRRDDDPRWRFGADAQPRKTGKDGRVAFGPLGPGRYTLSPGMYIVAPKDRERLKIDTSRAASLSVQLHLQ